MNKQSTSDQTDKYYDENAEAFTESTFSLEMDDLYRPFLSKLKPDSKILDAGCGSGRDAFNFAKMGYLVTAFDASHQLVELAKSKTGLPVKELRFQNMDWNEDFDGIWACASLLHVSESEIEDVFHRLKRALNPKGVLYVSFKYGIEEQVRNGRLFSDYDEKKLKKLIDKVAGLSLAEDWVTTDLRPGREDEKWLNAILVRVV